MAVCDWNEDGRRDLIVGERNGYITFFRATAPNNALTNAGHIQSNGVDIHVDYNSTPFINDWNEDGKKDLLTGQTGEYGGTDNVRVYINTGTDSTPTFGNYTAITCAGSPINLQRACPVVYDLDRDGTKDLIVGDLTGYVWFYDNAGTNAAPVFNSSQRLSTAYGYIYDGLAEPHIHFNDWDGDSDLDLVFGEFGPYNGYIRLYENLSAGILEERNNFVSNNSLTVLPNPIVDNALIKYTLDKNSFVRVNVYSADGQLVASPINQYEVSGTRQFNLNLRNTVPPGVYFVQLETEYSKQTTRITLLK